MTRTPYSWLTWWVYSCPWERGLRSADLELVGYAPLRRPPEVSDRFCDWVDVGLVLRELSAYERWQVRNWVCGRRERLPKGLERKLWRCFARRGMT